MARMWHGGAETGAELTEAITHIGAGATLDTAVKRTGAYSYKSDSTGTNIAAYFVVDSLISAFVLGTAYYMRAYFRFDALPTATTTIMRMGSGVGLRITSAGKIQLWDLGTSSAQIGSDWSGTIATDGTWYCLELGVKMVSGANDDYAEGRVNGTSFASSTTADINTTMSSICYFGWQAAPGASKVCYIDDVALNDDSTANQNSWPGEGALVLLLPTSDNARDTLWTGGVGGTTNLYDAVNNTPPIGTATETDLTQIEHAGGAGGTTDRYDANMTTYTAAGVPSGATVNVVQFIEVDGEDVSTGAKLLNFEVLSNPAIASPGNVTAGNGSALGTFPTNWVARRSGMVYSPSVTLGTAPVMRARRPETATRVASVCFMGIYVDYTAVTGYTLDATGAQTFSETGQAATLRVARKLSAGGATYSMSGTAVGLKYGRKVGIAPGSYSEVGQDVGLQVGRKVTAGAGDFAESGQDVTLTHGGVGVTLPADPGSYSQAGQDAGLRVGRKIAALSGSFTEVGSDVTLTWAQMRRLTAEAGSFSEVGSDVALTHGGVGYILTAEAASYAESGQDAVLRLARKILAAAGDFSAAGTPVTLRASRRLSIEPGSFAESGAPVALAAGRQVSAAGASYSEVGQDVALRADRRLIAEAGSYTMIDQSVTLSWSGEIPPDEILAKLTRPNLPQLTRAIT